MCGCNGKGMPLEKHHVFFGRGLRAKSDKYGLVVKLCHWCHNEPPDGVHYNADSDRELRQMFQRIAMDENNWTIADFIREFGQNYLDDKE